MAPLTRIASLLAVLAAAGWWVRPQHGPMADVGAPGVSSADPVAKAPCPAGSLPDDGTCIPVPTAELSPRSAPPTEPMLRLRPDKNRQSAAYRWPADAPPQSALGDGIVQLPTTPGTPIRAVSLDGQKGDSQVLRLAKHTLLLSHPGAPQARLPRLTGIRPKAGLKIGSSVKTDEVVGKAIADSVGFETRRLRAAPTGSQSAPSSRAPQDPLDLARSVRIDPRNMLKAVAGSAP